MKQYTISVDIAKRRDFTAIQIYRDTPELIKGDPNANAPDKIFHFQDLVYQYKVQDITYSDLISVIVRLLQDKKLSYNNDLIVDGTGVGQAVVDLMRDNGLRPIPIVATGGGQARPIYADAGKVFSGSNGSTFGLRILREWHVPKVDMVQAGQVAMERHLVRIAPNVAFLDDFRKQLGNFKGKFNEMTKYTSYNAEDDNIHDDFITAYLQAMWWTRNRAENAIKQGEGEDSPFTQDITEWNALDR